MFEARAYLLESAAIFLVQQFTAAQAGRQRDQRGMIKTFLPELSRKAKALHEALGGIIEDDRRGQRRGQINAIVHVDRRDQRIDVGGREPTRIERGAAQRRHAAAIGAGAHGKVARRRYAASVGTSMHSATAALPARYATPAPSSPKALVSQPSSAR